MTGRLARLERRRRRRSGVTHALLADHAAEVFSEIGRNGPWGPPAPLSEAGRLARDAALAHLKARHPAAAPPPDDHFERIEARRASQAAILLALVRLKRRLDGQTVGG